MNEKVELTALWKNTDSKGQTYLSGVSGKVKWLVFPNNFKEKETDPDYRLYVVPHKKKEEGTRNNDTF